ncbi:CLUMA_CG005966, isoform A [Clunio marinus]|uniref:CLUMA_CG005966, isoform A n=1 Tax=Clunio marinus TaxID=568069 RepID=A0A1J1I0P1_9DIPT|nr:CLUMA_CG005966, isoform A [Clunio marinus]
MMLEIAGGVLFAPFVTLLVVILLLASMGKSFGIRKAYVQLLLKLFEYGRVNIESAYEKRGITTVAEEEIEREPVSQKPDTPPSPRKNGLVKKLSANGISSLISKESLLLVPEGGDTVIQNGHTNGKVEQTEHIETVNNNIIENSIQKEIGDKDDKPLDFKIADCLEYVKSGMEAIIEDDVTSRFEAEELKNWNLLTRTNRRYEFISWKLTVIWVIGFLIRYIILMPLRVIICFIGVVWFVIAFGLCGFVPNQKLRRWMNDTVSLIGFRIISRSLSAVITFYNEEYKPKNCGFCVANHTSPIDVCVLASDCTYSLVYWLTFCTALVGCIPDCDSKRRIIRMTLIHCFDFLSNAISAVVYYHNPENRPVNGICVANHTSPIDALVLMCDNNYSLIGQRHGGFLGVLQRALARASPHIWFERAEAKDRSTVAARYDARFGDAFWNSSRYSMMQYLYMMMTSWAIVCDVWYLPPMYREEGESAIDFANRVKSVIAKQGGLVDLVWDGQLKRMKPKKEWKEKQQEEFTKRLKGD